MILLVNSGLCFLCPVGTIDNSPVVHCWDKRHIHIRISPVGTTEKTLHEFANSIRNVSPIGSMVSLRLSEDISGL